MARRSPFHDIDPRYQARARGIYDTLQSFFIEMPRGDSFVAREDFQLGYDALAEETAIAGDLSGDAVLRAIRRQSRAWVVLRTILGMTPGETAWLAMTAADAAGIELDITQDEVRDIDLRARHGQQLLFDTRLPGRNIKQRRYDELLRTAVPLLASVVSQPVPQVPPDRVHRLEKVDTTDGQVSLAQAFSAGVVPYSELLYERYLGRPYASHRDSISTRVGRLIDDAVAALCERHHIPYYSTKDRESIPGFPQAPDILIPNRDAAQIVFENKITEDDGTARDKVARIQTLRQYEQARPADQRRAIIAVIDGRGFRHRPADLQRMLEACEGHVYTLSELSFLVRPGGPLEPYIGTSS